MPNINIQSDDTISAIATGIGAGIGIVRISGSNALDVAAKVFRSHRGKDLQAQKNYQALYGHIVDGAGQAIDEAIALIMRSPHSYTAEDVVELQCHGGQAVLRKTLQLTYEAGARPAQRGEFTKRAFLNGRLDLTQAQSVMDVVKAKTDLSLTAAENRLEGRLAAAISGLRNEALGLLAHLEAAIDFPEDDVEEVTIATVTAKLTELLTKTETLIASAPLGRILREGLPTAIVGKPNVGKSSLLNLLAGEERAIVTDIPGTTRDSIEAEIELGGILLRLVDTAGIRESGDVIETYGVERAKKYAVAAELILAVFDGSRPLDDDDKRIIDLLQGRQAIALINKRDLPLCWAKNELSLKLPNTEIYCISTREMSDVKILIEAIHKHIGTTGDLSADNILVAEETQEIRLKSSVKHLRAALEAVKQNIGWDFVSIDLRSAWEIWGEITGETAPDELIDQIFAKFCIGK